jgi:hypothetical protein
MFMNTNPEGVNQVTDLVAGVYRANATIYVSPDHAYQAVLAEFGLEADGRITFVELLIREPEGGLFYRNFLKMPDGLWRDSLGEKRPNLGELLTGEIMDFQEVEQMPLPSQVVGGGA